MRVQDLISESILRILMKLVGTYALSLSLYRKKLLQPFCIFSKLERCLYSFVCVYYTYRLWVLNGLEK